MKRSEAIEAIGKVLTYGKNGFPPEKRHAYGKKSLADMILTELESLGMLPPQKKGEFCWQCGEAEDNLKWSKE
jgi:hypothetical protein